MLLAIDLGNTNITCGLFSGTHLVHSMRAETRIGPSADEYAVLLRQLCGLRGVEVSAIDSAIIASVVPALTEVLAAALRRGFGCSALVFGSETRTDLALRVERPLEVGADRIVNAVAARTIALREAGATRADAALERGLLVVDLGTATKFDCVSPRGEFLGGVIAPGIRIGLEALSSRTAKLPRVELTAPPTALGRNTIECIQSGVVYGHAALVDGLIERLNAELPFDCSVIATGGFLSVLAPHTRKLQRHEPDLTLLGLLALHDKNSSGGA